MSFNENGLEIKFNEVPVYTNRPLRRCVGDLGIVSRRGGEPQLPTTVYRNPIERSGGRASRGGLGQSTRDADDGGAAFESSR